MNLLVPGLPVFQSLACSGDLLLAFSSPWVGFITVKHSLTILPTELLVRALVADSSNGRKLSWILYSALDLQNQNCG